jgi:imidazolonepropionase-like amidohydrolase
MKKVAGVLHRRGVSLLVGTDAMGFPLVTPGSSIHRELELLTEAGVVPYEAIRAATVLPARFLGRQREFGSIAVGKRADLLLVDGNPAEDIRRLRDPAGVMVRGRWLPRAALQQMLQQ